MTMELFVSLRQSSQTGPAHCSYSDFTTTIMESKTSKCWLTAKYICKICHIISFICISVKRTSLYVMSLSAASSRLCTVCWITPPCLSVGLFVWQVSCTGGLVQLDFHQWHWQHLAGSPPWDTFWVLLWVLESNSTVCSISSPTHSFTADYTD